MKLLETPQIALDVTIDLNESGELVVSGKDADGKDISRSGGLPVPLSSFLLLFNAELNDWQVLLHEELPQGYKVVASLKKAE